MINVLRLNPIISIVMCERDVDVCTRFFYADKLYPRNNCFFDWYPRTHIFCKKINPAFGGAIKDLLTIFMNAKLSNSN